MRPNRNAVLLLVVALAAVLPGIVLARAGSTSSPALTGSIALDNKPWICHGPVDLTSVSVTLDASYGGPNRGAGNNDAIHLSSGCTGRIGQIHVVQYQGDGVKVGEGAHDLTVGGGDIQCFARAEKKHQDGIQVMGGQRVTFIGLSVSCPTANDSSLFLNQGTASAEVPTDIVCKSCTLSGGTFTVRITHSIRSGVMDSRLVPGKFGTVRIDKTLAMDPVNVRNVIIAPGEVHSGPPKLSRVGKAVPAKAHTTGSVAIVTTSVSVDKAAQLRVQSLSPPSKVPLTLLKQSQVGSAVSGRTRTAIFYSAAKPGAVAIRLRLPTRLVKVGRTYQVAVQAVDGSGQSSSLTIPFRR